MPFAADSKRSGAGTDGNTLNKRKSNSILLDSSVRTLRGSKLLAPLPNLFRATFEQAKTQSPGEQWLQQRMATFDAGNPQKRKEVLEEFLEYLQQSVVAGMEELFSNQAHLFFVRLTSWFAVTLPKFYELPLQLKVFLAFLEFREQNFLRVFFESGLVSSLMHTLTSDCDCSDEVRCLVLIILHKLAAIGRYHKELLCSEGLIAKVMDCMSDGLQWETLKYAGRLLCELFVGNYRYQHEVLDSLQRIMEYKLPLAQRVGTQAVISLLGNEEQETPPVLQEPERHKTLVELALPMLDDAELRLGADGYCLLCRLVSTFDCDELLYDFAKSQVVAYRDNANEWLRMEVNGQHVEPGDCHHGTPFGGWWKMSANHLHKTISEALGQITKPDPDALDTIQVVKRSNALFSEAFRKESGHILKWALVILLAKRSTTLCHDLVAKGFTETLLMCLLDVSRPVQQGAALSELHRLQLVSKVSRKIVACVLVRPQLIDAGSLTLFMQSLEPNELEHARFRLRSVWKCLHEVTTPHDLTHSADELNLNLELLENDMAEALGAKPPSRSFLTDVHGDGQGQDDVDDHETGEQPVTRPGKERCGVRLEDIPFCNSLSSLTFDPLDIHADEDSPLIQEMRTIETFGTFHFARRRLIESLAVPSKRKQAALSGELKSSHHSDIAHQRALALRKVPSWEHARVKPRAPPIMELPEERPESSMSYGTEISEMSLRCGDISSLGQELAPMITHALEVIQESQHRDEGEKPSLHDTSLAETTVGPDWPHEQSNELSSGPSMDFLAAGQSWMTGTESTDTLRHSCSHSCSHHHEHLFFHEERLSSIEESPHVIVQRSPMVAIIEIPKPRAERTVREFDKTPRIQKRVLQVTNPPHHVCMAFDPLEAEREREQLAESSLMHPKTKRLLNDINAAGVFPRKNAIRVRKVPPLPVTNSVRSLGETAAEAPEILKVAEQTATESIIGAMTLAAEWHAPGSPRNPLQNAGERLKSYFPASARSAP